MTDVVVIGAGMGGLAAALSLARSGRSVILLEARSTPGGLASRLVIDGFEFDAGPYILLDLPGLQWLFEELGLEMSALGEMRRIDPVYRVRIADGSEVVFEADLAATAAGFDRQWPGSGERYIRYVERSLRIHRALRPMLETDRPGPLALIRSGAIGQAPFLLSSAARVLRRTGLPAPVVEGLTIWTRIAGQPPEEAPSPLTLVPAIFHFDGAWLPERGVGSIPALLASAAVDAGVDLRLGVAVEEVLHEGGRATGVRLAGGEQVSARAVLSNAPPLAVYSRLLDLPIPPRAQRRMDELPLQSPGVIAYLAVRGAPPSGYLRFTLPRPRGQCRVLVEPAALFPPEDPDAWRPARLIAPMDHTVARSGGSDVQARFLAEMLDDGWWREGLTEWRVLQTRTPMGWGTAFSLHEDSMNPVMTARFMRQGRMPHRSPWLGGLYFAGSSTHPGQWISFCGISGVVAARRLAADILS